jgi:hypothetical protein
VMVMVSVGMAVAAMGRPFVVSAAAW